MYLRINGCRVKLKALVNNKSNVNLLYSRFLMEAGKIPVLNGGYLAWFDTKKRMLTLKLIMFYVMVPQTGFSVTIKKVKIISLEIIKKLIQLKQTITVL
ncbi:hypothetical protein GGTG_02264, partial [Gaeumannomyces tritici R3-111a-1]